MRMPLAAHSASILRLSARVLSVVATFVFLQPGFHNISSAPRSDQIAAQHQRGGGLASGAGIVVGAAGYLMKSGAIIKPDCRRIVFVDFQEHGARAQSGKPP